MERERETDRTDKLEDLSMGDRWMHRQTDIPRDRQTDRQKNRSMVIQAPNQLALSQKFISPIFINFLLGAK